MVRVTCWRSVSQKLMELWNWAGGIFYGDESRQRSRPSSAFFLPSRTGGAACGHRYPRFHEFLERNPAESHRTAGGYNDHFFVGECENTLQGIWSGICQIASGAFELLKNVILAPVLLLIDLVTGNFFTAGF